MDIDFSFFELNEIKIIVWKIIVGNLLGWSF